jgi:alternate signal-mediated exported protein
LSRPALSAAASVLAGVGLLLGAPHAFGSVGSSQPITPGVVEIEVMGLETAASGQASDQQLVVVPGETVTFTAAATVTVNGEALSATLRLDTAELFAVAPTTLRGELEARTHVQLEGFAPVSGTDDAWLVPARDEPYEVEAVISVTMPDLTGMQGRALSTGELSWSLTQNLSN